MVAHNGNATVDLFEWRRVNGWQRNGCVQRFEALAVYGGDAVFIKTLGSTDPNSKAYSEASKSHRAET